MSDDYRFFERLEDGYLSVSPILGDILEIDGEMLDRRVRHVSMKLGTSASHGVEKKQETKEGIEVFLRATETGSQTIKAYFYEDTKQVKTLTIQRWMTKTGNPHSENSIVLYGEQLELLLKFVKAYSGIPSFMTGKVAMPLSLALENSEKLLEAEKAPEINEKSVVKYLKNNPSLIKTLAENNLDESDVVSLSYRKKQLSRFFNLLNDEAFFEKEKNKKGDESVWQSFFEENMWIFGYGLNYCLNAPLEGKKLEQTVRGHDHNSSGKRVDALLKTLGIISSLSFGEIKTHKTPLLHKAKEPYRSECWRVSDELSGAIAQVQKSVQVSLSNIKTKTEMKDKSSGDLTGEQVFLYQPKSFLIIGSLSQFQGDGGVNEDKYSSFELFRRQIGNTEIITFDELYERAKYIVESGKQT